MQTLRFPEENSSFPQSGAFYAEDKDVFGTLMRALQEVAAARPSNPIQMLIRHFMRKTQQVVKIAVIGPPLSGRHTLAIQLAEVFDVPLLDYDRLYELADAQLQVAVAPFHDKCEALPPEMAFSLLRKKVFSEECTEKGWILCGFPETRAQDDLIRRQGVSPQKIIILNADPTVLLERRKHCLFDPVDKRPYNNDSYMPMLKAVAKRLVVHQKHTKGQLAQRIQDFAYESILISKNCSSLSKDDPCCMEVDTDRSIGSIFSDALHFSSVQSIQSRPFLHRLLFIGRPGSGKKTVANWLAQTFHLYHISSGSLIMRAATDPEHESFKEINVLLNRDRPISDEVVGEMVCRSLTETELLGYILRGFPQNRAQAELLDKCGFRPSRVFFFDCPSETAENRLIMGGERLLEKSNQLTTVCEEQSVSKASLPVDRKWDVKSIEAQISAIRTQDKLYNNNENDLRTYYHDISFVVDACKTDLQELANQIRYLLMHPMPLRTRQALTPVRTTAINADHH